MGLPVGCAGGAGIEWARLRPEQMGNFPLRCGHGRFPGFRPGTSDGGRGDPGLHGEPPARLVEMLDGAAPGAGFTGRSLGKGEAEMIRDGKCGHAVSGH